MWQFLTRLERDLGKSFLIHVGEIFRRPRSVRFEFIGLLHHFNTFTKKQFQFRPSPGIGRFESWADIFTRVRSSLPTSFSPSIGPRFSPTLLGALISVL